MSSKLQSDVHFGGAIWLASAAGPIVR